VSWVVRIEGGDPATIEIAAALADTSGWAQDGQLILVGFTDQATAAEFAAAHEGAVEASRPWGRETLSHVTLPTGEIELEVGTAFGHGAHPTTRLALDALVSLGPGGGRTVLDVGTGTGVLSVAAARQGFVATGCDTDPEAVAIAGRNAERNSVETRTSFVIASPSQLATPQRLVGSTGYDVVIVNTLVGIHEAEGIAILQLCSPTATIIATGLQGQAQIDRAVSSYAGFHVVEQRNDPPWSAVVLGPSPMDRPT
jgi:ribosomal protein L11 methyltransferase